MRGFVLDFASVGAIRALITIGAALWQPRVRQLKAIGADAALPLLRDGDGGRGRGADDVARLEMGGRLDVAPARPRAVQPSGAVRCRRRRF